MYKRPQLRKKPEAAAEGAPAEPRAAPPLAKPAAGGGLLGGILQNVAKMEEARSKAALPDGAGKLAAERAAEARIAFEQDAEALMRSRVLDVTADDAVHDFPCMERPWRDLLHEVAASLGLFSESLDSPDGEERYVSVRKHAVPGELTKEELKALELKARHVPVKSSRPARYEAPPPPPLTKADTVVVLNVNKRDLRSIEEVQGLIAQKKAREASQGEGGSQPQ